MSRNFDPNALLPIELEMIKEKASSLGAVGRRLEQLIEQMRKIESELAHLAPHQRAAKVAEHAELRGRAEAERWKFIVQREAMGLTRHDDVDRFYPIPPALTDPSQVSCAHPQVS